MAKRVFVANLPTGAPEKAVRELFGQHGELVGVRMLRVNGCAFVDFSSDSAAETAMVSLNGAAVGGSLLRVEMAPAS